MSLKRIRYPFFGISLTSRHLYYINISEHPPSYRSFIWSPGKFLRLQGLTRFETWTWWCDSPGCPLAEWRMMLKLKHWSWRVKPLSGKKPLPLYSSDVLFDVKILIVLCRLIIIDVSSKQLILQRPPCVRRTCSWWFFFFRFLFDKVKPELRKWLHLSLHILPSCKMNPVWNTIGIKLVYDWYSVGIRWYTVMCGGLRWFTGMVYDGIRWYTLVYGSDVVCKKRLVYDWYTLDYGSPLGMVYDWYTIGIRLVYRCDPSHIRLRGFIGQNCWDDFLKKHVIKLKPREW